MMRPSYTLYVSYIDGLLVQVNLAFMYPQRWVFLDYVGERGVWLTESLRFHIIAKAVDIWTF